MVLLNYWSRGSIRAERSFRLRLWGTGRSAETGIEYDTWRTYLCLAWDFRYFLVSDCYCYLAYTVHESGFHHDIFIHKYKVLCHVHHLLPSLYSTPFSLIPCLGVVILLIFILFLIWCICMCLKGMCIWVQTPAAARGVSFPWSWSWRQLWAAQHGAENWTQDLSKSSTHFEPLSYLSRAFNCIFNEILKVVGLGVFEAGRRDVSAAG